MAVSGFKKEVRDFMAEVRAENSVVTQQNEIIGDLREQNQKLLDRLMATNFKELQTYTTPEVEVALGDSAETDFSDEELIGEVIDVEGKNDE